MNTIRPSPSSFLGIHISNAPPHRAVTLEPTAKPQLPNPISFPHPPLGLRIPQPIPHRTARRIAKPMQRHPRRFHFLVSQLQHLLQAIHHRLPAGMQAEMVERASEFGHESRRGSDRFLVRALEKKGEVAEFFG
ncbi:hypothetical protein IEQ34_020631 [Dendrobium chrysotoxum]|uniref:Uncharacterized protein n=1 Tax=Dendrobium chrysotoxum TaxID=161865 RepID=A0AAV7FKN2_DENCH|nr:hypothetical protein IEQ34_020631 [Dendrobium chrysotoxum]